MSLSIGLVGLPNVGKSTLFNALTHQNALIADYPFTTIEPNLGIVALPDNRVNALAEIFKSLKTVPATVSFTDIAGLVEGASRGEGLGNKFLDHIRQTKVIAQIVGAFRSQAGALRDIEIVETELLLADWQMLDQKLQKIRKLAKGDKELAKLAGLIEKALEELDASRPLRHSQNEAAYAASLSSFNLLTLKPTIYVFNLAEADLNKTELRSQLAQAVPNARHLFLSAKLENELSQLGSEETELFLKEYDLQKRGIESLAEIGFETLGLQTFLTAGINEARAWIIPRNCPAPQAAGIIHSDMERGFIAADIVSFEDLKRLGSWAAARTAGVCRTEGKNYAMRDGDVAEFKFNV